MPNRIVLITGATSGIGFETALGLARMGGRIIMHGRNAERLAQAAGKVRARSGNQAVETLSADLLSQAEIRRLAREFSAAHDRLDVLVNNAGAIFPDRRLTADGYERTWALNHLGYVALTLALIGALRAAKEARIVNVASRAHCRAGLDFDNLQGERRFAPMDAYSRSKLGNVFFTYALARRLEGSGITANCLHPGVVATGFGRTMPALFGFGIKLARPFFISAAKGARTSIFLASSPEASGISGAYFADCRRALSSALSHDGGISERLWRLSLEQVGAAEPVLS
ncbi:MAG: SDR family oxidoreductase [Acetobacteraceae bacterium]